MELLSGQAQGWIVWEFVCKYDIRIQIVNGRQDRESNVIINDLKSNYR